MNIVTKEKIDKFCDDYRKLCNTHQLIIDETGTIVCPSKFERYNEQEVLDTIENIKLDSYDYHGYSVDPVDPVEEEEDPTMNNPHTD